MKQHLRIWEIALLAALCVTFCTGLFAQAEQNKLSDQLIRLHVIANSDRESDQVAKLDVRDHVLALLNPKLEGVDSVEAAESVIRKTLPGLCKAASLSLLSNGMFYTVKAELCIEQYPSRTYDGFALPSGDYVSLKIILGEGEGRNWWCVVFPPLCMTSAEDTDAFSGLTEDSVKLIKYEGGEYRLRFRIIELYEQLKRALS